MGTNKALLPLAGKPLVEHAVTKLKRLCTTVKILSNDAALASYASLVLDRHPDCGPMSGIEAALLESDQDWNLILPVDVPFLTTASLEQWLWAALHGKPDPLRLAMLANDGTPHPTLLIVNREVGPYLSASLEEGKYKLLPALRRAALAISARVGRKPEEIFWESQWDDFYVPKWKGAPADWRSFRLPEAYRPDNFDEFMNLNTREDFAAAEKLTDALDT